ncbi:MAG TPA: hypothetical protein VK034_22740, partial [Enhygromyxa sp.]|nr:hypothetical protein [Enhygromyxa sp.]
ALVLARAARLDEAIAADRNVVWRSLGDGWFEGWEPRLDAATAGLDLRDATVDGRQCPELGHWLVVEQADQLAGVGLDPEASRVALEAALSQLDAPATGAALVRALEADLGLACSAPLINLLHAGPHLLALETLDERLIHAPELSASMQLQLHAEIAAAHGAGDRALLRSTSAAAESVDPRAVWARAATAGRSFGAREYTLEALRQVILHSDGLDDPAARREMLLIRLRDVDRDEILRDGDRKAIEAIRRAVVEYLDEAPRSRRWSRLDELLWALAREPRADALAWTRLRELLEPIVDEQVADRHREALAALAAMESGTASAATSHGGPVDATTLAVRPELAQLGDTDAICEQAIASLDGQRLLGAAIACGPRTRAEAFARLVEVAGEARAEVRARILAGPIVAEIDPERPGVLHAVPAWTREGLGLRVAFDLPLDPVWITD